MKCKNCGEPIRMHNSGLKHFDGEAECKVVNWHTGERLFAEKK